MGRNDHLLFLKDNGKAGADMFDSASDYRYNQQTHGLAWTAAVARV